MGVWGHSPQEKEAGDVAPCECVCCSVVACRMSEPSLSVVAAAADDYTSYSPMANAVYDKV